MGLPASWNEIPVTYAADSYPENSALAGQIIRVEGVSTLLKDGALAFPGFKLFTLDENGELPAGSTLPSANDTENDIAGVRYRIKEQWGGGRTFTFLLPFDDSETPAAFNIATAEALVAPEDLESSRGLRGYSAYELAYEADPSIGTLEEWLASLGGIQGPQGEGLAIDAVAATYATLPGGLGAEDVGYTVLVQADNLLYVWDGTAFPAEGAGVDIRGSVSEAEAARDAAIAAKDTAVAAALSAGTDAGTAGDAATAAGLAKDAAEAAAGTATTKAGEASTSAGAADTAKGAAQTAQAAAEAAKAASETAQGAAETAKGNAETAQAAAEAAANTASTKAGEASDSAAAAAALIAGTALLRHGTGSPDDALGNDGDYYLDDTAPKTLYGPKAVGAWPAGVSLQGATGPTGRIPNVQSVTSAATVTPTFDNDLVKITAQAEALALANPTGTAIPGLGMVVRIKDNGTARAISYGTQYRAVGITLPTTTVANKVTYIATIWNDTASKWDCIATGTEA